MQSSLMWKHNPMSAPCFFSTSSDCQIVQWAGPPLILALALEVCLCSLRVLLFVKCVIINVKNLILGKMFKVWCFLVIQSSEHHINN